MIVVTGATGQLGRLVIENLLQTVPASSVVAAVRDPAKAADLAARGVQLRQADYNDAASLDRAFAGAEKLLLISSNELGQRVAQHRAVIDAAVRSGIKLVAYTSLLHADTSPLGLAREHQETEALLKASGLPHVLLRNGWYTENYTAGAPAALQHGVLLGGAGAGRISSAARADYAAAAAAVLVQEGQAGRVYELAGDAAFTLADLAAELARQSGKPVAYRDLPKADYEAALLGFGLPAPIAELISDSDLGASRGALFDDGHQLSRLIGRASTPLAQTVSAALKA
ncbi:MAG TPA: SDR family oxidoreductase [Burkholderiaceae bacterium]|jgi:NAD(P)H dehydrogenase (quinone)